MKSAHYMNKRAERDALIAEIGEGSVIDQFVVDRGHERGPELHCLTDTGIIIIYNAATMLLITKLIARPGQIKRYYPAGDYPRHVLKIAHMHAALCMYW